jgi:hypothetical protein
VPAVAEWPIYKAWPALRNDISRPDPEFFKNILDELVSLEVSVSNTNPSAPDAAIVTSPFEDVVPIMTLPALSIKNGVLSGLVESSTRNELPVPVLLMCKLAVALYVHMPTLPVFNK